MHGISEIESLFIGSYLGSFFYGIYSGIFLMYIRHYTSRPVSHKMNNIIFYALCALYILCVGVIVLDIIFLFIYREPSMVLHFFFIIGAVDGCCDWIAQSILIYRCWIVWGRNIRVVILPSILAFTSFGQSAIHSLDFNSLSLATRLAFDSLLYIFQGDIFFAHQGVVQAVTSMAISTSVNTLVTGLIVFKIYKVYQEVKPTSDGQYVGVTDGSKLRAIMFIIIESGVGLFAIQLVQIVLYNVIGESILAQEAYAIIIGIRQMLQGITPTIILVRVSMGLSFYDKESMIESITESLHFTTANSNLNPETSIEHHESRDGLDDIDVQLRNDLDIEMVDR